MRNLIINYLKNKNKNHVNTMQIRNDLHLQLSIDEIYNKLKSIESEGFIRETRPNGSNNETTLWSITNRGLE